MKCFQNMNINKFTIKSQEAIATSTANCTKFWNQQQIENEHIFKGILEVDENVTPFILKKLNVNVELFKKYWTAPFKVFQKFLVAKLCFLELQHNPERSGNYRQKNER
jgi:ATP-dependent Clp protease ATP-binding subunit ClpB